MKFLFAILHISQANRATRKHIRVNVRMALVARRDHGPVASSSQAGSRFIILFRGDWSHGPMAFNIENEYLGCYISAFHVPCKRKKWLPPWFFNKGKNLPARKLTRLAGKSPCFNDNRRYICLNAWFSIGTFHDSPRLNRSKRPSRARVEMKAHNNALGRPTQQGCREPIGVEKDVWMQNNLGKFWKKIFLGKKFVLRFKVF